MIPKNSHAAPSNSGLIKLTTIQNIPKPKPISRPKCIPVFSPNDPLRKLVVGQDCTAPDAYDATQTNQSGQYDQILKRSRYYSSIHSILQLSSETRGVNFFKGASEVTNGFGVGFLDNEAAIEQTGVEWKLHSPEAENLLRSINAKLLEKTLLSLRNS